MFHRIYFVKEGFKVLKKVIYAVACALLISSGLCGCEDKSSDDTSSEIYYGEAVKEVNRGDIYLIYDGRFVSDDEMDVLADYYISIQNKDHDKFSSTQPEEYINFLVNETNMNVEEILDREYNNNSNWLGEGEFKFTQIEVTDCGDSSKDKGISDIMDTVDGVYKDMGKDTKFSDTVKESKYVTYDIYAVCDEGEYVKPSQTKYIFSCEDGIYIF